MKTIKGPAIFLAQFAGDETPFNSLIGLAGWAAALATRGSRSRPGTRVSSTSRPGLHSDYTETDWAGRLG